MEPIVSAKTVDGNTRSWIAMFLGLSVVTVVLLWPRVHMGALRHWDEAWYAQVSREMANRSDWTTVYWNQAPWFHKPPLYFWATACVYKCLGVSEVSARLVSLLSALAVVLLLATFVGSRLGMGSAWCAGLLLLAIPEFCRYGTRGQLDMILTLFLACRLCAFWRGLEHSYWHGWGGMALGLALMTKGMAAALALVVEGFYILLARDTRPLRQWTYWGGVLFALLLAFPWHWQQYQLHGNEFLNAYGSRHVQQFFHHIYPEVEYEPAPRAYYVTFLFRKQWVWGVWILFFLLWGAYTAWREGDRFMLFAWCWGIAIPLTLSFAHTKWSWYLVPMYPGVAILATMLLSRLSWWNCPARRSKFLRFIALLALATASEVIWTPANREYEDCIRALAGRARRETRHRAPLWTLQTPSARSSIYPTAVAFYCQRVVHPTHSQQQLLEVVGNATQTVHALVHESQVETIASHASHPRPFAMRILARSGPVVLLRLVPNHRPLSTFAN